MPWIDIPYREALRLNRHKRSASAAVSRRGFSLVELVTAIALIATLAGLVFVGVRKMSDTASVVKCTGNLRQLGAAVHLYVADHNGFLPYGYFIPGSDVGGPQFTWDVLISPYLGRQFTSVIDAREKTVLYCPAEGNPVTTGSKARRSYAMARGRQNSNDPLGVGVAASSYLVPGVRSIVGYRLSAIPAPAETIMITEYSHFMNQDGSDNQVGGTAASVVDNPSLQKTRGKGVNLHHGTFNYLFVDGSVRNLKPESTFGKGSMEAPLGLWSIAPDD